MELDAAAAAAAVAVYLNFQFSMRETLLFRPNA